MPENKRHRKSPIKDLPVRMPGQSIRERIEYLFDEVAVPWIFAAFCMIVVAFLEWIAVLFHPQRSPWLYTIMAALTVTLAGVKLWRTKKKIKSLHLGQIGEEAVGQYLEEKLRPAGYQVLHDIHSDSFNVDHVLVGPGGIYAIETKTHSKPVNGPCMVTYDGEKVKVNGFQPDRDPVIQALSEARWLRDLIESSTGKEFKVQPVVLYPGWFVKATVDWPEVWLMNHLSFTKAMAKRHAQIDDADVHLITYHLKRYVIAMENQAKAAR